MGWFYTNLLKIPQEHPTFGVHIKVGGALFYVPKRVNTVQASQRHLNSPTARKQAVIYFFLFRFDPNHFLNVKYRISFILLFYNVARRKHTNTYR